VSPDRACFHLKRARRLAAALDEAAALESLLPPRKAATLVTSLRVLKDESLYDLMTRPPPRGSTGGTAFASHPCSPHFEHLRRFPTSTMRASHPAMPASVRGKTRRV
jgi:hypothetical protein